MEKLDRPAAFLLVRGGWVGNWLWDDVVAHLHRRDYATYVADLPANALTFDDYAEATAIAMRDALADLQAAADLYVVGHATGGAIIQRALEMLPENPTGGNPAGVIFLESVIVDDGESVTDALPGEAVAIFAQVAGLRPDNAINMHYLDEIWRDGFMSDANPRDAERWLNRLTPEPYPPMTQPVALPTFSVRAAAGDVGSIAYILLNGDATLPDGTYKAFEQKLAGMLKRANADARPPLHLALNAGHFAPLTRPFEVAESLIMTVTRLRVAATP